MAPAVRCVLGLSLLVACGDAPDTTPPDEDAGELVDAAPADGSPGDGCTPPGCGTVDAPTDAGPTRNCAANGSAEPTICLENVTGRAGDVVDVEVHLLGTASCVELGQSHVDVLYDPTRFTLANPAGGITNCRLRDPRNTPDAHVYWHAFTKAAVGSSCPVSLPPGLTDVLKFQIAANVPPGDYKLATRGPHVSPPGPCQGMRGIDGTVRVLP